MPNWCEGTLKVRGTKAAIKRWAKEALQPNGESSTPQENILKWNDDETEAIVQELCWIEDSRRGFVQAGSEIGFWEYEDCDEDELVIITADAEFAWACDSPTLAESSKKYGVDYYFYGFERGMEFEQLVEIHNGTVIQDKVINYKDYRWESISPNLGG